MLSQLEKAQAFRQSHFDPNILVLPNAWDVASAKIFERKGFSAVGTTSAGIAASLGYPDGEFVPKELFITIIKRITESLSVPITADIVNGYGTHPTPLLETIQSIIDCGAVGINIEDGLVNGTLADIDHQSEKIQAIRTFSNSLGLPLVINARIDTYWAHIGDPTDRYDHTIQRAISYLAAGADSIFIPSIKDPVIIQSFVTAIDGPINILVGPDSPSIQELEQWGVARVSFGSGPIRKIYAQVEAIAEEIARKGSYHTLADPMPYATLNHLSE
ncbi:isocitrate lyase/PEP mutase family protein [Marininema halotolerans]|uniref:2-Methylisocitrate lyase, PEP mutase family n=1 Tax=Marininema halotolerans TaxID=1155944 RepID=A0A1I6Q2T7_9BACL|nr:isocitrate lyase/phosphoenolpyruvate mutase family protein [Marininema halotolerans]SFS46777.1 2-Methylisocitrate lyase, PEP mutase family [Marininema halotolerans]